MSGWQSFQLKKKQAMLDGAQQMTWNGNLYKRVQYKHLQPTFKKFGVSKPTKVKDAPKMINDAFTALQHALGYGSTATATSTSSREKDGFQVVGDAESDNIDHARIMFKVCEKCKQKDDCTGTCGLYCAHCKAKDEYGMSKTLQRKYHTYLDAVKLARQKTSNRQYKQALDSYEKAAFIINYEMDLEEIDSVPHLMMHHSKIVSEMEDVKSKLNYVENRGWIEKPRQFKPPPSTPSKRRDPTKKGVMPKRNKKNFRKTEDGAGMTATGIREYRRLNPGSKLKGAVTGSVRSGSVDAKRRKSYCARSAGQMRQFPAAAADPNSRLRQARRRWQC